MANSSVKLGVTECRACTYNIHVHSCQYSKLDTRNNNCNQYNQQLSAASINPASLFPYKILFLLVCIAYYATIDFTREMKTYAIVFFRKREVTVFMFRSVEMRMGHSSVVIHLDKIYNIYSTTVALILQSN